MLSRIILLLFVVINGEFATMPFAGPVSVYGTNGYYKWGGKSTCGISKVSNEQACNFSLYPRGPDLDLTTKTGLKDGVTLPNPAKCDGQKKEKDGSKSSDFILNRSITFAANPEQYGTNGYWKVNLKKSQNEDGTPGPLK